MPRKTQSISLVPLQSVAPLSTDKFVYPVSDLYGVSLFFNIGKVDSSGPSAGPAVIRIEGRAGTGLFYQGITSFPVEVTAPAASVVTGSNPAGANFVTVVSVPSTFKKGDYVFVRNIDTSDASFEAGSEWARIKSTGSTSITFAENLTNNHIVTGTFTTNVYSLAECWPVSLNVASFQDIRILIDSSACTKPIYVEAWATILDSP